LPFFVAFYSYKGGVGRSLALANVGYALASRGKRVVLIDMDLEAPGLHDIPELALRGSGSKKGFLEYAASYRRTGKCPAIGRYVHECRTHPGAGRLWVMPAGSLGEGYQTELGHLPWRRLHPRNGTEPFLEGLRGALAEEIRPDYVLIDSRTGLSDVGGLSTHRLADMVVLVFNLTRSCLEGSVRVYRSFTSEGSRVRSVQLVASPVPPQAPDPTSPVERRLAQAIELMPLGGRSLVRVDYHPAMVLAEELAVRKPDAYPAAGRYESLRESIQRANSEEVFPVLEEALELRAAGRLEEGLDRLRDFIKGHPGSAEGHLELGNLLFESGRAQDALGPYRRAAQIAPDFGLAVRRLGEALAAAGSPDEAIVVLRRAEELGQKSSEVYVALVRAYSAKGDVTQEIEAGRKAVIAILREAEAEGVVEVTPQKLPELRREFVEFLDRRPPFSGFQPEAFWDGVMGSLSLSFREKLKVIQALLAGSIQRSQVSELSRILAEERTKWESALGMSSKLVQEWVAKEGVDPSDVGSLLQLYGRHKGEPALLLLISGLLSATPMKRGLALLRESVARDPEDAVLLKTAGDVLTEYAKNKTPAVHRDLLNEACQRYLDAVEKMPGFHAALNNWGEALRRLATLAEGEERNDLLEQACSRYQEAVQHKPDSHEALYNWGNTLGELAQLTDGDESKALLEQACSRYQEAVQHKPDKHEALNNWGIALGRLAQLTEGDERKALLEQACSRYQEAVQHKPDKYEALNNWGIVLGRLAQLTEGDESKALLEQACSRYQGAVQHKPDSHEALYNWGNTLGELAQLTEGDENKSLLEQACSRYQGAVQHKPDLHEALYNWGNALAKLAQLTEGGERRVLLLQACSRYQEAVQHKPDKHEALNNWGIALEKLAQLTAGDESKALLEQACSRYQEAVQHKPDKHEALNNWGIALAKLAQLTAGDESKALLEQACSRYQETVQHKPDKHEALNNWGIALVRLAQLVEGVEKKKFLEQACSRYHEAMERKPDKYEALDNWASALLYLTQTADGAERQRLATEAAKKARLASEIQERSGDYNLACALSQLGQFDEAEKVLIAILARSPEQRSQALDDSDFLPLWEARPQLRGSISAG
jgi:Tfp pilus assembly protein PilF/cellulose biosynthesis protein BcsQ